MGSLTIYRGGAHTGKSTALYQQLKSCRDRGRHAILLVPEQATYDAERRLCDALGGLLGVEVYSFERFSERLLAHEGVLKPLLSVEGRQMVLRRAAYKNRNALTVFARVSQVNGFAETMDEWIGRLKQSCITPEDLFAAQQKLDGRSLLSRKLHDVWLLYRDSEAFLKDRYLTAQDLLTAALTVLPESNLGSTDVYIDDLDRPREQVMRLLKGILLHARSVTMTVKSDDDPACAALFHSETERVEQLRAFCAEQGLTFSERVFRKQSAAVHPALRHLTQNLFSARPAVFAGETDAVTITGYATAKLEAEETADRILALVREQGLRFSEIAVVTDSLEAYVPLLTRAFRLRGIPLFFDASRPILGHAASDYVLCSVRAASNALSVNDLLHVLKSGYAGVDDADTEQLENYLLRYGLFGSSLTEPLSLGEVPEGAERARGTVVPRLLALREALTKKSAAEKVRGVYAYLCESHLSEQLQAEAEQLRLSGEAQDAQTYAQMWNTLMTLFSQIDAIMGDTPMGMKEFCALLEEGLSGYRIGVVPGTTDQVVLGDLVRTRLSRCKTLFLLGCNEGVFPPVRSDDALFNDAELERMEHSGLSVWGNSKLLSAADRLQLYTLLSKATDRLYFSYACSGGKSELSPSALLRTIETMFSMEHAAPILRASDPLPPNETVGLLRLSDALRTYHEEGKPPLSLPLLLDRYRNDPNTAARVQAMEEGRAGTQAEAHFSRPLARMLYGEAPQMSASRLEQFARCPFAQYLKFGLSAKERKEARERADNVGTLLHDALDAFVKTAAQMGFDLKTMTEEQKKAVFDEILPPLFAAHNEGIYTRNVRLYEARILQIRLIDWCVRSVLKQIQNGAFSVAATEAGFGKSEALKPIWLTLKDGTRIPVQGKIDRIDKTADGALYRIVDYKTGRSHTFDPTKFLSGETIQLPLYLEAAKQLGGEAVGMYYMPLLADPPESETDSPKQLLSGVTADDPAAIDAADPELEKKSELIRNLGKKKDGSFTGDLVSRAALQYLTDRAIRIASEHAYRILDGEASVYPTESACTYCPYDAVCRFDRQLNCRTHFVSKRKLADLFAEEGDTL